MKILMGIIFMASATALPSLILCLLSAFAALREKLGQRLTQRRKAAKQTHPNLSSLLCLLSVPICVHLWSKLFWLNEFPATRFSIFAFVLNSSN